MEELRGMTSIPSSTTTSPILFYTHLTNFQTNLKGPFLALKSFVPTANSSHAAVLSLTSGMTAAPAKSFPRLSAYMTSKFAHAKMMEFLPLDQPHIFAATVHPGMVETAIFTKAGGVASNRPMDKGEL